MKLISWKRFSLLMLLVLVIVSFGCSKKVAAPPPPPAPAPPPPPPPPAPTVTLNADRTTITTGQSVTLSYTAQNATSVTINPGVGAVTPPASGTRQVSPMATTSYTATATGPGGTANSAAVTVTVNQPPAPPPPPRVETPAPPPPPRVSLDELFTRTMVPILFDFDKYSIRSDQEPKLLSIAAWLKQNPTVRFTIEGHADERGSQEYNIALGDERAASTKKYLVGQGVAENRMNTVSYGEERPVCRDSNEMCWQENRRAAFVRIP
jgi:peptidoglycan-associated lipoprotein